MLQLWCHTFADVHVAAFVNVCVCFARASVLEWVRARGRVRALACPGVGSGERMGGWVWAWVLGANGGIGFQDHVETHFHS